VRLASDGGLTMAKTTKRRAATKNGVKNKTAGKNGVKNKTTGKSGVKNKTVAKLKRAMRVRVTRSPARSCSTGLWSGGKRTGATWTRRSALGAIVVAGHRQGAQKFGEEAVES